MTNASTSTSLTLSFPVDQERPRPGTANSVMASATTVILPSSPPCFSLQSCRVERCGTPPPSRGAECGTPLSAFFVVASTGPSICVGTVAIQCCSVLLSSLLVSCQYPADGPQLTSWSLNVNNLEHGRNGSTSCHSNRTWDASVPPVVLMHINTADYTDRLTGPDADCYISMLPLTAVRLGRDSGLGVSLALAQTHSLHLPALPRSTLARSSFRSRDIEVGQAGMA